MIPVRHLLVGSYSFSSAGLVSSVFWLTIGKAGSWSFLHLFLFTVECLSACFSAEAEVGLVYVLQETKNLGTKVFGAGVMMVVASIFPKRRNKVQIILRGLQGSTVDIFALHFLRALNSSVFSFW